MGTRAPSVEEKQTNKQETDYTALTTRKTLNKTTNCTCRTKKLEEYIQKIDVRPIVSNSIRRNCLWDRVWWKTRRKNFKTVRQETGKIIRFNFLPLGQ